MPPSQNASALRSLSVSEGNGSALRTRPRAARHISSCTRAALPSLSSLARCASTASSSPRERVDGGVERGDRGGIEAGGVVGGELLRLRVAGARRGDRLHQLVVAHLVDDVAHRRHEVVGQKAVGDRRQAEPLTGQPDQILDVARVLPRVRRIVRQRVALRLLDGIARAEVGQRARSD